MWNEKEMTKERGERQAKGERKRENYYEILVITTNYNLFKL